MHDEKANIQVTVPEAIELEVMLALNREGGLITNLRRESSHWTGIEAAVPKSSLASFKSWLQEFTKGQGRISGD
jgi:translation elongation factor EF-G